VAAVFGVLARDHHLVAFADAYLVVAAGTAVRLVGLIRLDMTDVDVVVGFGPAMRVHNGVTVPKHCLHRCTARRRCAACVAQDAGSGDRDAARASSTFARSGSRIRLSQAPCHSHAAPQPGHETTTEPPDHASASIGVRS
jgi:hypothetical protein